MDKQMNKPFEVASVDYNEVISESLSNEVAGDFVTIGDVSGFVGFANDGAVRTVITKADKVYGIKATGVIAAGAKVYFSASSKSVSTTNSDVFVGHAVKGAGANDESVIIDFNPNATQPTP